MKEWILWSAEYFLSNWHSLLTGGVVVIGVVIFLMGVLKKFLINRIKNSLIRKIILSWLSVVLTFPVTVISILYRGYDFSHIWSIYLVNAVGTILVYWFYENTAIRDALNLLGKKTVTAVFRTSKNFDDSMAEIHEEAEALLSNNSKSQSIYKDDDLKNL